MNKNRIKHSIDPFSRIILSSILLFNVSYSAYGQDFDMVVQNSHIIEKYVISNDGQLAATASRFGGELKIWDLNSGFIIKNFKFIGMPNDILITSDKKYLIATGGSMKKGIINIWEIKTGLLKSIFTSDLIIQASLSPDETMLIACEATKELPNPRDWGRKIYVYDFPTLNKTNEIYTKNLKDIEGSPLKVEAINDGIIIQTLYGKLSLASNFYSLNFSNNQLKKFHKTNNENCDFKVSSKYVVIREFSQIDEPENLIVIELESLKKINTLKGIKDNLFYSISENEEELFSIEQTKNVHKMMSVNNIFDGSRNEVPIYYYCLVKYNITGNGRSILVPEITIDAPGIYKTTYSLSTKNFKNIFPDITKPDIFVIADLKNKTERLFSPSTDYTFPFKTIDNKTLIYSGERISEASKNIIQKNLISGKVEKILVGNTGYTSPFVISNDNRMLIGSNKKTDSLLVWNLGDGERVHFNDKSKEGVEREAISKENKSAGELEKEMNKFNDLLSKMVVTNEKKIVNEKGVINRAVISPDCKLIVSADNDNLYLWDVQSKSLVKKVGDYYGVNQILFIDNNKLLIAHKISESKSSLSLIDLDGSLLKQYEGNFILINTIGYNRDEHYISAGYTDLIDGDGNLTFWNIETAKQVKQIKYGIGNAPVFQVYDKDKTLIVGDFSGDIKLYDTKNFTLLKKLSSHTGSILQLELSEDGRYLYSSGVDKKFIKWNLASGNIIYTYVNLDDPNKFFVYTPDGYFDCSADMRNSVAYNSGLAGFSPDQFAVKYNRPDIVLERMGCQDKELLEHYKKQYFKRLRRIGVNEEMLSPDMHVPQSNIDEVITSGKTAIVKFHLNDDKYSLKSYNVFINDIPLFGAFGKTISGLEAIIIEKVELCGGLNKIEISCVNEKASESYRALTEILYNEPSKSNLYILSFGVSRYQNPSLNLQYAAKDALDLEQVMQSLKGKGFENVYTKVLTNEQVTPQAIKAAKDFVKNAKVDDTFILFIAGHGMHDTDPEATYYYLTYNADLKNLKGTAADFETIEDLLQGIPPRNKLFLMDACESGELDEEDEVQYLASATQVGVNSRGFKKTNTSVTASIAKQSPRRSYLYQKDRYIYNDLVRRSGAIVFSSSKGGELSYERSDIENGLFTEYIMKALNTNEADKDANGIVSTDELRAYVSEQVAKASGGLQHPTVDRDNIYQKFGFRISNR